VRGPQAPEIGHSIVAASWQNRAARAESLPAAPARRLHQPAGLHVLGQSKGRQASWTMSSALAEQWARAMGRFARALTGLACKRRGKKRSPHSGRARNSMGDSRAPFRASPIVAEKTRPQGCSPKKPPKDRQVIKAASFAHHEGLSDSPFTNSDPCRDVCVRHEGLSTIAR
jgi:hypothetical protein